MTDRYLTDDALSREIVAAAPPVPGDAALSSVHDRALTLADAHESIPRGRLLRVAGAIAIAAVIIGVAFAFVPRGSSTAFASDRAVEALLLPAKGVLHTKSTFTEDGRTEQYGALPHSVMIMEDWRDAERRVMRNEVRREDGTLSELGVVADGVYLMYGQGGVLNMEKNVYESNGVDYLIQTKAANEVETVAGGWGETVRAGLESGELKVIGEPVVDGEPCWEVGMTREDPAVQGSTEFRVLVRKSDYRLKRLSIHEEGHNGNGDITGDSTLEVTVWEVLDADSLPDDFFSLEAPVKAAKPGTRIEKR